MGGISGALIIPWSASEQALQMFLVWEVQRHFESQLAFRTAPWDSSLLCYIVFTDACIVFSCDTLPLNVLLLNLFSTSAVTEARSDCSSSYTLKPLYVLSVFSIEETIIWVFPQTHSFQIFVFLIALCWTLFVSLLNCTPSFTDHFSILSNDFGLWIFLPMYFSV